MFTGIIEVMGSIAAIAETGGDRRMEVAAPAAFLRGTHLGDSIAVNGACLTVAAIKRSHFAVDVSRETLCLTTFGAWRAGTPVNLERALQVRSRLGGHFVSGHVDGLARLETTETEARSQRMTFAAPRGLARYIARKGSITIDGVSLTVNQVRGTRFGVNIVPHTLTVTTLGALKPGDAVHLEVDLLARYLEKLLGEKLLKKKP